MSDTSETKVSTVETVKIVWKLFTNSDRVAFIRIVVMVIVGMFLETISLGIVVPIIGILTQDDYQQKYPFIVEIFGNLSREELISAVMVAMVLIYVVRSLFLFWSLWIQKGFSASVSGRLSQSLFSIYLRQPYMFHLQRNSSTLMRNAKNATSVVTCGVDPFLVLLTDGLVAIAMFALLIAVEPVGTLAVLLVFGLSTFVFQRTTRRRIDNWGYQVDYHETKILQHLQEGFGGAKDVKVLGRENEFLSQHEKHLGESIRINRKKTLRQSARDRSRETFLNPKTPKQKQTAHDIYQHHCDHYCRNQFFTTKVSKNVNDEWILLLIVILRQNSDNRHNNSEADRLEKHSDNYHYDNSNKCDTVGVCEQLPDDFYSFNGRNFRF